MCQEEGLPKYAVKAQIKGSGSQVTVQALLDRDHLTSGYYSEDDDDGGDGGGVGDEDDGAGVEVVDLARQAKRIFQ